jgi:hypothetical protein
MMEAAYTSETSVDIQLRTRQYISEDSELQVKSCFIRSLAAFVPFLASQSGSSTVNTSGFDTQRFITAWDKLNKGMSLCRHCHHHMIAAVSASEYTNMLADARLVPLLLL